MKVKKLELVNFKRFKKLSIESIPVDTKLILLVGSNGNGKSSIFDSFNSLFLFDIFQNNKDYYLKNKFEIGSINLEMHDNSVFFIDSSEDSPEKFFFEKETLRVMGRTSSRYFGPEFENGIKFQNEPAYSPPLNLTENDRYLTRDFYFFVKGFTDNYTVEEISKKADKVKTEFIEYTKHINNLLKNILWSEENHSIQIVDFELGFNGLKLIFQKGQSKFEFGVLSHGEKQILHILVFFLPQGNRIEKALIYFDELDVHLNSSIQYKLISEIVENLLPHSSQLWVATHSMAFIQFADQNDKSLILDFNNKDFDKEQIIEPKKDSGLDIYNVAIPKEMLANLFAGRRVVYCENKNDALFNLMGLEKFIFVGIKDSKAIFEKGRENVEAFSLRDKDFLMPSEVQRIKNLNGNLKILEYYNFENYMYHPDNLDELALENYIKTEYVNEIVDQKNIRKNEILLDIIRSRQTYTELKFFSISAEKDVNEIANCLESDIFDTFYPYFDMKKRFKKTYKPTLNITHEELVKTNWFKNRILEVLEK